MNNFIIRPITAKDYNVLREIDIETQIQYLGLEKWEQMPEEEKEANLVIQQNNFEDFVKNGFCFLAESEGKIIGFILAYETVPVYGEVFCQYIAISPASQGKGVGGLLFEKLIETARERKMKKIWSLINPDNPNSIMAHQKAGFKLIERKEAEYRI